MQTFLVVFVIIVLTIIALGMLIYFLLPKRQEVSEGNNSSISLDSSSMKNQTHDEEIVNIIDVKFKGYPGKYTYATPQNHVKKDQCVLVLTQDGIRCAQVVCATKKVIVSELPFPHFLLQSIICVADESDLDYYQ